MMQVIIQKLCLPSSKSALPIVLVILVLLDLVAVEQGASSQAVTLPGHVTLGGLFPVHEKSTDQSIPCSHKVYNRGIQRLEAMLYAVDTINNDPKILKGITIGVNILDTCGRDTYALNQSLEFIRSSLNNFDVSQYECSLGGTPRLKFNSTGPVLGVIGGHYSSVSIQISPASTAKALSDKSRFEMFARTVPPDTFQAIALVDIVKSFNWTYVSTIASEGSYGESGIEVFQHEAEKRNICIAVAEKVPSNADDTKFLEVVRNLLKKPTAKAVVLFTRMEDARGILKAARRLSNAPGSTSSPRFHWLASDGWGKQSRVVDGFEDVALGAITVELESKIIQGFDDYMNNLTPFNNIRNMWFRDYWQDKFNCEVPANNFAAHQRGKKKHRHQAHKDTWIGGPGGAMTLYRPPGSEHKDTNHPKEFKNTCDMSRRLGDLVSYEQDSKVQFVIDGVYAFAYALDRLKADVCPDYDGVCPEMSYYDGGEFYKNYLLKVDFQDIANSTVKFDEKGDGLARYTIYNYKRDDDTGKIDYKVVGKWHNKLDMETDEVMFAIDEDRPVSPTTPSTVQTSPDGALAQPPYEDVYSSSNEYHEDVSSSSSSSFSTDQSSSSSSSLAPKRRAPIPISVCSFPCKTGEIMIMNTGDTCCWICQKCQDYEFMLDKHTCQDCGNGRWPYKNKTACYDLELKYMRWNSVYSLVPIGISALGIVLTLTTIGIFVKYRDTPLVRASGRELTYVILFGLLICYVNTFILLAKPGTVVCLLERFTVGMGFSLMYGALLTKTNRISRIFHSASQSARRPSYISPRSQLIITSVLASVQFLGTVVWVVASFPASQRVFPRREEVILKCNVNDSSFLISQVYNGLLICICTYYAIKTRKVPENFNEAKFIGFTMYTTCVIWLAFVPIYFGTGNSFEIQIMTLCISVSLSAYVTLGCLFSPKLYIIVFQPEKNVRKLTMNSAAYKKTTTSLLTTAAHTVMAANVVAAGAKPQILQADATSFITLATVEANGQKGGAAADDEAKKKKAAVPPDQAKPQADTRQSQHKTQAEQTNPSARSSSLVENNVNAVATTPGGLKATLTPAPSPAPTSVSGHDNSRKSSTAIQLETHITVNKVAEIVEKKAREEQHKQQLQVNSQEQQADGSQSSALPSVVPLQQQQQQQQPQHLTEAQQQRPKRISFTTASVNGDEDKLTTGSPTCSSCEKCAALRDGDDDDDDDEEDSSCASSHPSIGSGPEERTECRGCNGGLVLRMSAHALPTKDVDDDDDDDDDDDESESTGAEIPPPPPPMLMASYRPREVRSAQCTPKKNMATSTAHDVSGASSEAGAGFWANRARFASLPRSGGSSAQRLLEDNTNSSLSLNDSPRHLVTYVTSSLETIPVEINQDIPDVML